MCQLCPRPNCPIFPSCTFAAASDGTRLTAASQEEAKIVKKVLKSQKPTKK